jgi:hypothetical protein
MAFRPNYNQQRGDRDRAKQQKKLEKLQRRDEDAAKRRAERGENEPLVSDPAAPASDPAAPAPDLPSE